MTINDISDTAKSMVCAHTHAQLKADPKLWNELVFVGIQHVEGDESGPAEAYEVRDCPCGSTLYRKIEPPRTP